MPRKTTKKPIKSWKGVPPEKILEDYPENYSDCRGSHDWPRRAIWHDLNDEGTVRERTVICRSCTYSKTTMEDDRGNRVGVESQKYPQGYLTPGSGLKRAQFIAVSHTRDYNRAKNEGRVRSVGADVIALREA